MNTYTYQEAVIYMRVDCPVCRSEGFEAPSRAGYAAPVCNRSGLRWRTPQALQRWSGGLAVGK